MYAVVREGAYRYDPRGHRLKLVDARDLRGMTGTQEFAACAPLNLVYVADYARMEGARPQEREFFAGADSAFIAQNVYLFCACHGLATVARALIDRRSLAAALRLPTTQRITLAQSVGYPARGRS